MTGTAASTTAICDTVYLIEEHHPASSGPAAYWFEAYLHRQDARQAVDDYITRHGRPPLRWDDHGPALAGTPTAGATAPSYLIVTLKVRGPRHEDWSTMPVTELTFPSTVTRRRRGRPGQQAKDTEHRHADHQGSRQQNLMKGEDQGIQRVDDGPAGNDHVSRDHLTHWPGHATPLQPALTGQAPPARGRDLPRPPTTEDHSPGH